MRKVISNTTFTATVSDGIIKLKNLFTGSELTPDNGKSYVITENPSDADDISLHYNFKKRENCLSYTITLANTSEKDIFVKEIVMFSSKLTGHTLTVPRESSHDPSKGEAHFIETDFSHFADNYPIFIDDDFFCGIDWPAAYNHFDEENVCKCTHYCNVNIKAGEHYTGRSMTFGVSEHHKQSAVFSKHLNDLRDRFSPGKSMYFTWLTHAWEGMNFEKLARLTDYLIMLFNEYNIKFDVVLLDAGIIETLRTYYSDYRLIQGDTIDKLPELANRLKKIGTDLGIWLGPDGFGTTEEDEKSRIDLLKKIISDLNVSMIKLDVAVSYPMSHDRRRNEQYMTKLECQMNELRKIRPDLIVINHRISGSPYILTILDSTLWEGMETYPDVYLLNTDKPRPNSRLATYSRGIPSYCRTYNRLLEDHGVCFNGNTDGWQEDLIMQAFGRSLIVSPELYGTLFSLTDNDYPILSQLLKTAEDYRTLRADTIALDDMFIHSDGKQALICIYNDSVQTITKPLQISKILNDADTAGLEQSNTYCVSTLYPAAAQPINVKKSFSITLSPFQTVVVTVTPLAKGNAFGSDESGTINAAVNNYIPVHMSAGNITPDDERICELIPFNISSNPIELQIFERAGASAHKEAEICRRDFTENAVRSFVVDRSAWDGNTDTAWGAPFYFDKLNAVTRLNLRGTETFRYIEITLSQLRPGPILGMESGEKAPEIIDVDISPDGINWRRTTAKLFNLKLIHMAFPSKYIADFGENVSGQYIKIHSGRLMISDITLKDKNRSELSLRDDLKGNNLLPEAKPEKLYSGTFSLTDKDAGIYVTVSLSRNSIPLTRLIAYVWAEDKDGNYLHAETASPAYPFNGWENNTYPEGNAWSYMISTNNLPRNKTSTYTLKCALYRQEYMNKIIDIEDFTVCAYKIRSESFPSIEF